ncbi:MAG: right-handed parallel beta-helix repeat-containing protein [Bacteroidota bacterium]
MKNYLLILLVICLFSCEKAEVVTPPEEDMNPPEEEIMIPEDAIEFLDFETQTTHLSMLSIYAKDKEKYTTFESHLNDQTVDLFASLTIQNAGYYELSVNATTSTNTIDTVYQFVIIDEERGEAEWGIKKFTPSEIDDKSFALSDLNFFYPQRFPKGLNLPILFNANVSEEERSKYYAHLTIDGNTTTLKRGIGSLNVPSDRSVNTLSVKLNNEIKELTIVDTDPEYIVLESTIEEDTELLKNEYYHITSDLTIMPGTAFIIPQGCVIKIDEGVNIYNMGTFIINGIADNPTVITCSDPQSFWGGIISMGTQTTVAVNHSIIAQSGFHDSPAYQYGHAKRQALFYLDNSDLAMLNSHFIDHIGQIFYLINNSTLWLDNSLIQRAKTAGEVSNADIIISNSTFTDFPEYSNQYQDEDNDCIYINRSDAVITNSTFMWSKDDGIDSGSSGGGEIEISDCHFEGIFHEAIALSSANNVTKTHTISNCAFKNCGQGIELGYSSPNHNVTVSNCQFEECLIGVRYGDNYDWSIEGFMELIDCQFDSNLDLDTWNFVRSEWAPKNENFVF